MAIKKAFIFDTNFIIQNDATTNKKMEAVINPLKEKFNIYITQVSINERIAQFQRTLKEKFDKIPNIKQDYKGIATITVKTTFDTCSLTAKRIMQERYEKLFPGNIIPFKEDQSTFSCVLERAYAKIAPFSSADNASDKGFKDSLMWLSILAYFKEQGETEVLFITEDQAFIKNAETLCIEFKEKTGKTIEIKQNSYYKSLIMESKETPKPNPPKIPNIEELRDKIREILYDICIIEDEDYYGNFSRGKAFILTQKIDETHIESIFNALPQKIETYIFEKYIWATKVFEIGSILENGDSTIPLKNLEKAVDLHESIKKNYPHYLFQFYTTATSIFNQNYERKRILLDDDSDIPF